MTEPARQRYDRERLLDAAAAVFTERGFDGTSMEDLARATGLSKSSLYHHVSSKEQLLRLLLDRALSPLLAVLEEPAARQGPAVARLEHVVRREVEVLVEQLPSVTLLLRVRGRSGTEREAMETRRAVDRAVAELVRRAQEEGDVRADLDPATTARLVSGAVNSLVEWYRPGGGALPPQRLADAVLAVCFHGLLEPAAALDRTARPDDTGPDRSVG